MAQFGLSPSAADRKREREAKSFVVCWLNVFKADKQKWSENRTLLVFWHGLLCLLLQPSLYPLFCCSVSPSLRLWILFSLSLFQAWADAFRSSPDLTGVVQIYEELKRKGIEFPMADLDALSPIHTPQRVRRKSNTDSTNMSVYIHSSISRGNVCSRVHQRSTQPWSST